MDFGTTRPAMAAPLARSSWAALACAVASLLLEYAQAHAEAPLPCLSREGHLIKQGRAFNPNYCQPYVFVTLFFPPRVAPSHKTHAKMSPLDS